MLNPIRVVNFWDNRFKYGIRFRDLFTTNRAAGAVNATASEPGTGTRTVTDTENKLSISDGYLDFSGPKASPAYGNPGFWITDPFSRVPGRTLITAIIPGNASTYITHIGFDDNKASTLGVNYFLLSSNSEVKTADKVSGTSASLMTWYLGEKLYFAVILKAAGADYWVRRVGGAWTLINSTTGATDASVYAGLISFNLVGKFCFLLISDVFVTNPTPELTQLTACLSINILAYGDSKTLTTGDTTGGRGYPTRMSTNKVDFVLSPDRIGVGGQTVASMKARVDADLAAASGTPDFILCNLGANDVGSMPVEATWKANYQYIFSAMRTKWTNVKIYVMRPWRRGYATECNTLASWIGDLVVSNPGVVYEGPDERVFLENGDDGVTYTGDGIHPNAVGYTLTATKWRESIGY